MAPPQSRVGDRFHQPTGQPPGEETSQLGLALLISSLRGPKRIIHIRELLVAPLSVMIPRSCVGVFALINTGLRRRRAGGNSSRGP